MEASDMRGPGAWNPAVGLLPLLTAALLAACGAGIVDPEDADARLRTPVVPDASWGRMERDLFTYRVPPGFENLDLQPIDSDAVTHASGTSSLHHDYGMYTGPWSLGQNVGVAIADVVEQTVRIGGRAAQLVSYRSGGFWTVRAWWEMERHGHQTYLLLEGRTEDPSVREQLLAAIYSVRFR
jgi:hypothetical protein